MGRDWVEEVTARLPRHGRLIAAIREAVVADERWRWFDVACSLGSGRGDEWSDVDGAIGFAESCTAEELELRARTLVHEVGDVVDMLVHAVDGAPGDVRRVAVEYADDVQLDLVLMPASLMTGLRIGEVAVVDKDGHLDGWAVSDSFGPPDESTARAWALTAWWNLSDVAKYIQRGAWFEAVERIGAVRHEALKLLAVAQGVPYPIFGLTSLLDYEPFEVPADLARTYAMPDDVESVAAAATAVADLLAETCRLAARRLAYDLSTAWQETSRRRLRAATERA